MVLLALCCASFGQEERGKCEYGADREKGASVSSTFDQVCLVPSPLGNYLLCVGDAGVVEVGENTSLPLYLW